MRRWVGAVFAGSLLVVLMAVAAWGAAVAVADAGIPFSFKALPLPLRDLPLTERPFSSNSVVPRVDNGLHDAEGASMRKVDGKLYDFPRGQANYGLGNLNSYRITGDQFYLDRALVQADRLLADHDVGGDAWYYPNYPSRYRHGRPGEFIQAPYYSALPQGRALMLFSRLGEMTGDAKWTDAAYHTFLAYLRPGPTEGPYVLDVDSAGYYWLQEWPWPGMKPDDTFNGHNSSAFGLFEYWSITKDERAAELFRGAMTTVLHYLPEIRRPQWISCYCLLHRGANPNYHNMHIGQLLTYYHMTGDAEFARWADKFSDDYPKPDVHGGLQVEPGAYAAVKVDRDGHVLARRSVTVKKSATWVCSRRQRLWQRSAIYLRADSGPARGWWLPERTGKVTFMGIAAVRTYNPARTLVVAAGKGCSASQFDDQGRETAKLRIAAPADDLRLAVDRGAFIDGRERVRVSGGDHDGFWVTLGAGVRLY